MYKVLIAILLVLPGGFVLAPAITLWVRRSRRGQQLATATAEAEPIE